jgi:hypothetical protein
VPVPGGDGDENLRLRAEAVHEVRHQAAATGARQALHGRHATLRDGSRTLAVRQLDAVRAELRRPSCRASHPTSRVSAAQRSATTPMRGLRTGYAHGRGGASRLGCKGSWIVHTNADTNTDPPPSSPPTPEPPPPAQPQPAQKQPNNNRNRRSIQRGKRPMKDTANSVVPGKKAHQLLVGPPDTPGSSSSHARYNDSRPTRPLRQCPIL